MTTERRRPHPEPTPLVLVVDDDAGARKAMREILTDYGYAVATADNGATAMAIARETPPDLVISDVRMPHIDGFELAAQLRARVGDDDYIPIILVSAHGELEQRVEGLDLGADDFLTKPVDVDELLARVRAHLRNANRHRALLQRAQRDGLTGVLNRPAIMRELEEHMARYYQGGSPLSVVLVDCDGSHTGAPCTDDVLGRAANALRSQVRDTDLIGRYDGSAFLLVLTGLNGIEAARVALRMGRLAELTAEPDPTDAPPLVVTAGSATALPTDNAETLVSRAAHAMEHGRRHQHGRPAYPQSLPRP